MMIRTSTQLTALGSVPGATLPAEVAKAIDNAWLIDNYKRPESVDSVAKAMAMAIAEGKDPATDKAVAAAVVAEVLSNRTVAAAEYGWADAAAAAAEHADEIVNAWRPMFDSAANDLASAVPTIGAWAHDDEQVSAVLNSGGDAAAKWLMVKAALKTIETIYHAWVMLADLSRRGIVAERLGVVAELTYDEFVKVEETWANKPGNPLFRTKRALNAWDVARSGLPLDLASITGYVERMHKRRPPERAPLAPRDKVIPTSAQIAEMTARLSPEVQEIVALSKLTRAKQTTP